MKREIKFRGKRVDNGKWAYGNYAPLVVAEEDGEDRTSYAIYDDKIGECYWWSGRGSAGSPKTFQVDESTVGQYTGLKDKNGVEIYEGDIVKASYGYGETDGGNVVEFNPFIYAMLEGLVDKDSIKVIGNKWDNPELL